MPGPWAIAAALLLLVGCSAASFLYGKEVGRDGLLAKQARDAATAAARDAERSHSVDAIAAAAATAVAAALNQNAGSTHESVERIREVVVPGNCRGVDAASLRELRQAAGAANDALRAGVRQRAAAAGAGDPGDAP